MSLFIIMPRQWGCLLTPRMSVMLCVMLRGGSFDAFSLPTVAGKACARVNT